MQRLAKLVQHIVGYIGDIINRTLTEDFQTLDEPIGRWRNLYSANNSGGVSWAQIRSADFNRGEIAGLPFRPTNFKFEI